MTTDNKGAIAGTQNNFLDFFPCKLVKIKLIRKWGHFKAPLIKRNLCPA
jgi:hypothetical protein